MSPIAKDIIADWIKIVPSVFVTIIVIVMLSKTVRKVSAGEAFGSANTVSQKVLGIGSKRGSTCKVLTFEFSTCRSNHLVYFFSYQIKVPKRKYCDKRQ